MILKVEGLSFSFGEKGIVNDVSFELEKGDVVAVIGPNGAGKSTLLRCIDGILHPQKGTVTVDDEATEGMSRRELSKRIGYVPQRTEQHSVTVFESILLGRRPYVTTDASAKDLTVVQNIISLLGLEHISSKRADRISGGELQMVQIARTLAQQTKVILLDEPTNNLDPANQQTVMKAVKGIVKNNGMCAVVVEHDLNLALRHSDKFIIMKEGGVIAAGGIEAITPENIRKAYGIDAVLGDINGIPVLVPLENDLLEDYLGRRKRNPKQRDFFNDRAGIWDEISVHDQDKVDYITGLLELKDDMDILDVGTGTGVMIPHYLEYITRGHVTAVDYSENMIDVASSKYPPSDVLSYRVADIYDMDDSGIYDRVVCYSCFPHFPDPVKAVEILSRALKKGGLFCIAHSSSKEHINRVHETGGQEICNDYLPELDVMERIYRINHLDVVFERDDDEYYIVIGKRTE